MQLAFILIAGVVWGFHGCLSAVAEEPTNCGDPKEVNDQYRENACNNFYQYVCASPSQNENSATPSALKARLYKQLEAILGDRPMETEGQHGVDERSSDAKTSVKTMAKELYSMCTKDAVKKAKSKVKKAVLDMLTSLGIKTWPIYADGKGQSYEDVLSKTGLRPLASIGLAPNEEKTTYILTMNILWPRFPLPPTIMKQTLKGQDDKYEKYKTFVASVLDLFLSQKIKAPSNRPSDKVGAKEGSANSQSVKNDRMKLVMDDILEVEMYISELIRQITRQNFTIRKISEWQEHFGKELPITEGLKNDFNRAGIIFNPEDSVGIHNIEYFEKVGAYMSSLTSKKVTNYVGWYFAREIADVLTEDVRKMLNEFLASIPKPRIPVTFDAHACIDKLIGHQGAMEEGISHLYLRQYFDEPFIKEASAFVPRLNSSFQHVVDANSWMDDDTKETASKWLKKLLYHIGASEKLLSEKNVMKMYDRVNISDQDSLPLYIFKYKENNFLQKLRLYKQSYRRKNIWPQSPLETQGRYSAFYTSVVTPAAALQEPVFRLGFTPAELYGSVATLTAEALANGFTQEGLGELHQKGKYEWSEVSIDNFDDALLCLEKRHSHKKSKDKKKLSRQEKFDKSNDKIKIAIKLRDHIALRTSFSAFMKTIEDCKEKSPEFQETASRQFFVSYARRLCRDGTDHEDEHSVNYALKTYKEFWEAFGCDEGTPMRANDTCKIVTS